MFNLARRCFRQTDKRARQSEAEKQKLASGLALEAIRKARSVSRPNPHYLQPRSHILFTIVPFAQAACASDFDLSTASVFAAWSSLKRSLFKCTCSARKMFVISLTMLSMANFVCLTSWTIASMAPVGGGNVRSESADGAELADATIGCGQLG